MTPNPARLSRLLWESREAAEMFADVAEQVGKHETWFRDLVKEIDAFRAEQGWSPNGFGGEQ